MDLKWSNYDFTKIPYNDLVSVGQRTLLIQRLVYCELVAR